MKFKPGDKVRRIRKNHPVSQLKIGDVLTFKEGYIFHGITFFFSEEFGKSYEFNGNYFELASNYILNNKPEWF